MSHGRIPPGLFVLPRFAKPEYFALQHLSALLTEQSGLATTQAEVLSVGIRLMAEYVNTGRVDELLRLLADYRETAPSETPPLINP